jgi:hypothetical protein
MKKNFFFSNNSKNQQQHEKQRERVGYIIEIYQSTALGQMRSKKSRNFKRD